MVEVLIGLFVVGVSVPTAFVVRRELQAQRKEESETWDAIAKTLGLQHLPRSGWKFGDILTGTINGVAIRIETRSTEQLRSTLYWAHFPNTEAPAMSLTRRPVSARVLGEPRRPGQAMRAPNFEQLIKIQAHDEQAVDSFLTPHRREALHRLFTDVEGDLRVTNTNIEASTPDFEPAESRVVPLVWLIVDTATTLRPPQDRNHQPPAHPQDEVRREDDVERPPHDQT